MTGRGDPSHPAPLIDAADSILLIVDLQEGFLKQLTPQRREALVDRCRFLVEVAVRLEIPQFVTVEDAPRHGGTTERVHVCLEPSVPQRDKRIFGLCGQEDLREAILAQPRRTALLTGMETDVCVLHSAVGLLAEGFRAVIVSDGTESPGLAHEQGLARAAALGVELLATRGLYYEWIRSLAQLARLKDAPHIAPPAGIVF